MAKKTKPTYHIPEPLKRFVKAVPQAIKDVASGEFTSEFSPGAKFVSKKAKEAYNKTKEAYNYAIKVSNKLNPKESYSSVLNNVLDALSKLPYRPSGTPGEGHPTRMGITKYKSGEIVNNNPQILNVSPDPGTVTTGSPTVNPLGMKTEPGDALQYDRDRQEQLEILDMLKDDPIGTNIRPQLPWPKYVGPPEEPFKIEDIGPIENVELPPLPEKFSPFVDPSRYIDTDYKTLDSLDLLEGESIVHQKKGIKRFEALKRDENIFPDVIQWVKSNIRNNPFLLSGFMSEKEAIDWANSLESFENPKGKDYQKVMKALMDTYKSSFFRDESTIDLASRVRELSQLRQQYK